MVGFFLSLIRDSFFFFSFVRLKLIIKATGIDVGMCFNMNETGGGGRIE